MATLLQITERVEFYYRILCKKPVFLFFPSVFIFFKTWFN